MTGLREWPCFLGMAGASGMTVFPGYASVSWVWPGPLVCRGLKYSRALDMPRPRLWPRRIRPGLKQFDKFQPVAVGIPGVAGFAGQVAVFVEH